LLRLRVTVGGATRDEVVGRLGSVRGVRRVICDRDACDGSWIVSADVSPVAADDVLTLLHSFDLHGDDYVLLREEVVAPRAGPGSSLAAAEGFAWIEILGEARANARPIARYLLLMAVAGMIAGLGVITDNSILIIGAMAVSPDLLPLCATCVGLVGRRLHLAARAFGTLLIGMGLVMLVSAATAFGLTAAGILDGDPEQYLGGLRGLASADYSTVLIAITAGVAGILSFETRAANAVGVAISVTTVPASAFFGVAIAVGDPDRAWGALLVLVTNLTLLVASGSLTLWLQRRFAPNPAA
jgi:uncharacterized hydrophobic protein (TIGR00271 family)